MKFKIGMALAVVLLAVIVTGITWSQSVPQLINYQGRLADSSGQPPVDGATVDLTFVFYSAESGGTVYITVLQEDVTVVGGIYSVLIGSGDISAGTESDLASVFQNHQDVWMGVKVDSDDEMTPRARISSTPYALAVDSAHIRDLDLDGDGHYKLISSNSPANDCDDANPAVYGGAIELCDRIDNQCPGDAGYGFVDEGCSVGGEDWPLFVGAYDDDTLSGANWAVYVRDGIAYTTHQEGRFVTLDVSDPANPSKLASPATTSCVSQAIQGDYAYLADGSGGLKAFNISDPSNPVLAGSHGPASLTFGVAVRDNWYFAGDGSGDFISYEVDIQAPNTVVFTQRGSYNGSGFAHNIALKGDYAYLAADSGGLRVLDISDPASPSYVTTYSSPDAEYVFIDGDYAYLGQCNSGLAVLDISNPASPELVGSVDTPNCAIGVFAEGNNVYVADNSNELLIISVADPTNPQIVESYETPGATLGVFVAGKYAYIACQMKFLHIIQVKK
jgi:hypothetical protein